MNCDNCELEKNSLIAAVKGRMFVNFLGVKLSISWIDIRSLTTRSIRDKPIRNWFWINSPTERIRRFPNISISSVVPTPSITFKLYEKNAYISETVIVCLFANGSFPATRTSSPLLSIIYTSWTHAPINHAVISSLKARCLTCVSTSLSIASGLTPTI